MIVSFVCTKERHERTSHEHSLPTTYAIHVLVDVEVRVPEHVCVRADAAHELYIACETIAYHRS
jgi:hypothetical protein